MMNYSDYSYLILCEDKRQYYLVYSWLCQKGANRRRIRLPFSLPEGAGDAKQFVESHYFAALDLLRKYEKEFLIVIRDADVEDTADIAGRFINPRSFTVIPKRNIETWFYFIDNPQNPDTANEDINRKNQYPQTGTRPTSYGKPLEAMINDIKNGHIPTNIPASLRSTIIRLIECERIY